MLRCRLKLECRPVIAALGIALAASLAPGCGSSRPVVALEAPPPSAPRVERAAAYEALQIAQQTRCDGRRCFRLNDGRYVYRVDDLRAVLDPATPTSRKLRRARRLDRTGRVVAGLMLASGAAGAVLMVRGAVDEDDRFGQTFWIGTGFYTASQLGLIPLSALGNMARDSDQRAIGAYNDSLRDSLGL
jgi:hypothetical protein